MYCRHCGARQPEDAKFCPACGRDVEHAPPGVATTSNHQVETLPSTPASVGRTMGWYRFWTYLCLPGSALLGVVLAFQRFNSQPALSIFLLVISALYAVIALGLHKETSWGWWANWLPITINLLTFSIPSSVFLTGQLPASSTFASKLLIGAVIWLIPNVIYWKKRKYIFSEA